MKKTKAEQTLERWQKKKYRTLNNYNYQQTMHWQREAVDYVLSRLLKMADKNRIIAYYDADNQDVVVKVSDLRQWIQGNTQDNKGDKGEG